MKRWLIILMLLNATGALATVDLTLFNTFPLLDNLSAPLQGISTAGDLVQLILVGPNGVIDPPSISGGVGGDDTLLFASHIGAGLTSTNSGKLVQSSILYPDIFGGNSNAFVRFWDSNTAANAGFYGTSAVFTLPVGDFFGLAEYNFASLASFSANVPFGATATVPEPSNLFLLGLLFIGGWSLRRRRLTGKWLAMGIGCVACAGIASAQIPGPLDVTSIAAIVNTNGVPLAGSNPGGGSLVQIIKVGANGVADLPNPDGTPGGDDSVYATTFIGQGISPSVPVSGRFATSFYPPPNQKVYARVFNASITSAATHYGQSATFTVNNADVFDLSALGLGATTQPKGSNPQTTDSDGDGITDYDELIANTNPLDAGDRLDVSAFVASTVSVTGRAGRQYTLQRTTNDLNGTVTWSNIASNMTLNADQNVSLSDPNPPSTPKAFYRLRVTMP